MEKIAVEPADGKEPAIKFIATTTCWGPDSKPISATEFLERLFGDRSGLIADETDDDQVCLLEQTISCRRGVQVGGAG